MYRPHVFANNRLFDNIARYKTEVDDKAHSKKPFSLAWSSTNIPDTSANL